jgi:Zn-dependent peptidase ImmA (M78 family)
MVKLKNANITKYGSVQIKDSDLEKFASRQLRNYKKDYFKEPRALDVDDFVEFYLQKNVQYYKLSIDDAKNRPLGTTAITDGKVVVINEKGIPEIKIFKKGTIIIDEEACGLETRRRFTLCHEAWHSQFALNLNIERLNENNNTLNDTNLTIAKSFNKGKRKTAIEWEEYHADIYATFLLMPKTFINKLFAKYHKQYFDNKRKLTAKRPQRTWLLISAIAEDLNVSKNAVAYRLRALNKISEQVFLSLNLNAKKGDVDIV